MRRFFLQHPLQSCSIVTGNDAVHISRVLRMKPGDQALLIDPDGQAGMGVIRHLDDHSVQFKVVEKVYDPNEATITVRLAQALPKGDKMDFIVQKAVELGVTEIIPWQADHSVVKYDAVKQQNRKERWQRIAYEAAKQCGRLMIPNVSDITELANILKTVDFQERVLVFYEKQADQGLKTILSKEKARSFLLLIGPEGGFSTDEIDICQQHNGVMVSLGPRILRTETASLAALAVLMYEYGDLGG